MPKCYAYRHKMQARVAHLGMYPNPIFEFDVQHPTLGGKMIGVILWSDAADHKAVIWCEDHGDLAFLSGPDTVVLPDPFFEVGEIVEFDIRTERNLRVARNLNRLQQTCGTVLQDGLFALNVAANEASGDTATVIPFRQDPSRRAVGLPVRRQVLRG